MADLIRDEVLKLDGPVYTRADVISRLVHHRNGIETVLEVCALDMRLDRARRCRDTAPVMEVVEVFALVTVLVTLW